MILWLLQVVAQKSFRKAESNTRLISFKVVLGLNLPTSRTGLAL